MIRRRARRNPAKEEHRIYVADLEAYVNGRLKGGWIVPSSDVKELQRQVSELVRDEWAIHDYDNFIDLGEYPDLQNVADVAEMYETLGEDQVSAVLALMHAEPYYAKDVNEAKAYVEENYQGAFESEKDFVHGLIDDVGIAKDAEDRYFDAESFGRDVRIDMDTEDPDNAWAEDLTDEELGLHYLDEGIVTSETKKRYFDVDAYTRDLFIDDYVSYKSDGKYYVFIHR